MWEFDALCERAREADWSGSPAAALDHALADRALAIDPWMESAHRLVVAAHRATGDDLAARRALGRYREAIHDLGFGPDEATLMVERLLDGAAPGSSPLRAG